MFELVLNNYYGLSFQPWLESNIIIRAYLVNTDYTLSYIEILHRLAQYYVPLLYSWSFKPRNYELNVT